jgi:hypothetical protein
MVAPDMTEARFVLTSALDDGARTVSFTPEAFVRKRT